MSKLLIIGYGNPLREDDGVGWAAAQALAGRGLDASILACHQLTPELAEAASQAERVIFIDAAAAGEPGELACHHLEPAGTAGPPLNHSCDPAGILHLAQTLYGRAPEGYLLTITGHSFGYAEQLSPAVTAVLPRLYAKIEALSRRAESERQTTI